ncbi:ABC transporter ATP-binding protein [Alkaliphilus peptidifermentans]|uniref:Putative ABC transport system ATP-binding protein n=1 Tax=Alkaliphilus peptidifermentans DSM 18978 TaxID=1120976 RepID=A0A1G5L198_9FIRM|nr:ABC transporter ATP-binding protein [Alkaliphilus peptidifermentans]SCZ06713.1 putative ABC transport system ATP-binding protein [Alkaliphilus peptidifermentans DSM 18978]
MITMKNLEKTYHSNEGVLKVIDIPFFEIKEGSQIALVGPSGSGKTTFLNIISGLVNPTKGEIVVDGVRVDLLKETQKDEFRSRRIGYIFQNFNLVNSLSAMENVMLPMMFSGLINKRQQQERAKELLGKVNLTHRMHHKPSTLSKGEQQRVAIARALANDAKIILADEPTGNIDYHTGMKVFNLLMDLCSKSNITLVMVTHSEEYKNKLPQIIDIRDINSAITYGEEGTLWES